ncbi:hypothetical protein ABPG72_002407 [Tetrahymena utriculariae]
MKYVAVKIIKTNNEIEANSIKQKYQLFAEKKFKDSKFILQIKHLQMAQINNYYTVFIFTDLCQGDLTQLFEQKISKKQIIIIMTQLLIGLQELKQVKMLHSSIKPSKILYNYENGNYNVKIAGSESVLQFEDKEYVYNLEMYGCTLKYSSFEILYEKIMISYKSDIYSLGLVFIELIFGKKFDYQDEIKPLKNGNLEILNRRPQIEHRQFDKNDDYLIEKIIKNMIQQNQNQRKTSNKLLKLIFGRYLMDLDFWESIDYGRCFEKIKLKMKDLKKIKIIFKYLMDLGYECLYLEEIDQLNHIIKAKLNNNFLQIECYYKEEPYIFNKIQNICQDRSYRYVVPIIKLLHENLNCDYLLVITDNYEGDLRDLVTKKLSKKHIFSIIIQLLLGMAELKLMRVLHANIKPSSILFNYKNGNYHVKISDFSCAKFLQVNDSTDELVLKGATRKYASPETFEDDASFNYQHDIYSLGIVFIELIFGRFLEDEYTRMLRKGQLNILSPNPKDFVNRDFNQIDIFLIEKVIKNMICLEKENRYSPEVILQLILEFFQLNNSTNNQYNLKEVDNQRFEIIDEETQVQIRNFLVEHCGVRFYPITQEEVKKEREEFEKQSQMTLQKINLKCKELNINYEKTQEKINYLESIKCQCLEIIGRGTFGLVVKAMYQDKLVAIKIIEVKNEQNANKLKLEYQFLQKFQGNKYILNLRKILDATLSIPLLFIFTDLCQGELTDLINKNIPKKQIISIIIQLLIGLEELKSLKIIHVDIKPQNILYNYKKGNYQIKIADFGQARQFIDKEYAKDLSRFGTIKYTSKEIFEDDGNISYKSDVYSLGIVFIELIFGRLFDYKEEIRPLRQGKSDILNQRPKVQNRSFDKIDDFIIEKIIKNMIQQNQDERKYSDELLSLIFKQYLVNYDETKIIDYDECLNQVIQDFELINE